MSRRLPGADLRSPVNRRVTSHSGECAGGLPGLPALTAALAAGGRWVLTHQTLAQLLFWRPVPGFVPSPEAFAPSVTMVDEVRRMLHDAVDGGQVRPEAASEEGVAMVSILATGVLSQQLANAPEESFEEGRFTRLAPRTMEMFRHSFAPIEENHADRTPPPKARKPTAARTRRRGP